MAELQAETAARTWQHWLSMGIGGGIGFGVSNKLIRLGARVRDLLNKFKLTGDAQLSKYVGIATAMVVWLGMALAGWKKSGLMGDFVAGFGMGALADEFMALGV